jgi:hypothetical protein
MWPISQGRSYGILQEKERDLLDRPSHTLVFRVAAFVLLCAAVYHFVASVHPAIERAVYGAGYVPGFPRWRHLVWVGIDVSLAGLLLWRPRWLIWLWIVLVVEQLHGHGGNAWRLWVQSGGISWIDIAVLIIECSILLLLFLDWRARRSRFR